MLLRRVSWALLVGILLSFVPGSVAQQRYSDREALLKLNLSNQPGEIPAYYSACCRNRALEVQAALEDGLRFYREKLGIHLDLVTFSDGTTAAYVVEELLELRPAREPIRKPTSSNAARLNLDSAGETASSATPGRIEWRETLLRLQAAD